MFCFCFGCLFSHQSMLYKSTFTNLCFTNLCFTTYLVYDIFNLFYVMFTYFADNLSLSNHFASFRRYKGTPSRVVHTDSRRRRQHFEKQQLAKPFFISGSPSSLNFFLFKLLKLLNIFNRKKTAQEHCTTHSPAKHRARKHLM